MTFPITTKQWLTACCLLALVSTTSCNATNGSEAVATDDSAFTKSPVTPNKPAPAPSRTAVKAGAAEIMSRKQVPVLCYHDLKDWPPGLKPSMQTYYVPPARYREQIKYLADSGYHSITPEQYDDYLNYGTPLPPKPFMITFDDGDAEQYSLGAAELDKYGFKGVFFIMTIAIGKKNYMKSEELKALSDAGHVIGVHTWDHNNVRKYTEEDFQKQLAEPKKKLESITGKPAEYFAYPFGAWNQAAIPHIKSLGFKGAYQLAAKRDSTEPLYTLRRIMVHGAWDARKMEQWMKANFR